MSSNRNAHIRSLHDVVLGAKLAKIAGDDTCTEGGTTASEATPGDVAPFSSGSGSCSGLPRHSLV